MNPVILGIAQPPILADQLLRTKALSDISDYHEYRKDHDVTLMLLSDSIMSNLFTIHEVYPLVRTATCLPARVSNDAHPLYSLTPARCSNMSLLSALQSPRCFRMSMFTLGLC